MAPPRLRPALKTAVAIVGLLLAGVLAWALWPQEFRFERETPAGRERVAACTRWGCVVREEVLDEGGGTLRSRRFPVGAVPLWRIGALPETPGAWGEPGNPVGP